MKIIFLAMIIVSATFAIHIELKEGKESGQTFSTLNLIGKEAVKCSKTLNEFQIITQIECKFLTHYSDKLKDFSNSFFDILCEYFL